MVPRPLKGFQCPIHTVFAFVLCFLPPTFIYELRLDIKLTVALDTVRLHRRYRACVSSSHQDHRNNCAQKGQLFLNPFDRDCYQEERRISPGKMRSHL